MAVLVSQSANGAAGAKPRRTALALRPSWRGARSAVTVAALAVASVGSGGCSMSYQLGSLFGKSDDKTPSADLDDATGSTRASPTALLAEGVSGISEADIVAARRAAADMLAASSKGRDTSARWQNPTTGARGMVTPIADAYTQDGLTCRDFLASVVRDSAETWLHGEACRIHKGKWEVRTLKPWKRA